MLYRFEAMMTQKLSVMPNVSNISECSKTFDITFAGNSGYWKPLYRFDLNVDTTIILNEDAEEEDYHSHIRSFKVMTNSACFFTNRDYILYLLEKPTSEIKVTAAVRSGSVFSFDSNSLIQIQAAL